MGAKTSCFVFWMCLPFFGRDSFMCTMRRVHGVLSSLQNWGAQLCIVGSQNRGGPNSTSSCPAPIHHITAFLGESSHFRIICDSLTVIHSRSNAPAYPAHGLCAVPPRLGSLAMPL